MNKRLDNVVSIVLIRVFVFKPTIMVWKLKFLDIVLSFLGSILNNVIYSWVVKWLSRLAHNQKIVGSSPTRATNEIIHII